MTRHADPSFGYDPWLNDKVSPEEMQRYTLAATGTFYGGDTLSGDIGQLPGDLAMYASYIDNYGGWGELVTRFGQTKAFLLSITIFGGRAHCADVEPGAMRASSLPHWLDHIALTDSGLDPDIPWVYTSASNWDAGENVNAYIGGRRVVRWSAHYGHGYHICAPHTCGYPQADWTQCYDHGTRGENIDRSIGRVLPSPVPHPKPKPALASGVAHFAGHVCFDTGAWEIQPAAGSIKWGTVVKDWTAVIQVDGSNGAWNATGTPFRLALGDFRATAGASGTANFKGHVNFDTGEWAVVGTDGNVSWGSSDKWRAELRVDNHTGAWAISGLPFG